MLGVKLVLLRVRACECEKAGTQEEWRNRWLLVFKSPWSSDFIALWQPQSSRDLTSNTLFPVTSPPAASAMTAPLRSPMRGVSDVER